MSPPVCYILQYVYQIPSVWQARLTEGTWRWGNMIRERAGINTSCSTLKTDTISLKGSPSDSEPKTSIICQI